MPACWTKEACLHWQPSTTLSHAYTHLAMPPAVSLLNITAAGKLRQPAKVVSLPVFPMGLQKGHYDAEERQAAKRTKLRWARNIRESAEYEASP